MKGNDSKLYQALLQDRGYASRSNGGINYLGNMFNYNGPMLWMADLIHDEMVSPDSILAVIDEVVDELQTEGGIDQEMVDVVRMKTRSGLYSTIGAYSGVGLLNILASFALFDDNTERLFRNPRLGHFLYRPVGIRAAVRYPAGRSHHAACWIDSKSESGKLGVTAEKRTWRGV